jgi:hypothetical protein
MKVLTKVDKKNAAEAEATEAIAAQPNARECAILVAHLLATKQKEVGKEKEVTRARLAEVTLRRLFCRQRIPSEFLLEVQDWLLRSGWVLFFAGTTYAVVKTKVIEGWARISSKRIAKVLNQVARGQFEFEELEDLLLANTPDVPDEDT